MSHGTHRRKLQSIGLARSPNGTLGGFSLQNCRMVVASWYFNLGALLLDLDSSNQNIILVGVASIGKDSIFDNAT